MPKVIENIPIAAKKIINLILFKWLTLIRNLIKNNRKIIEINVYNPDIIGKTSSPFSFFVIDFELLNITT